MGATPRTIVRHLSGGFIKTSIEHKLRRRPSSTRTANMRQRSRAAEDLPAFTKSRSPVYQVLRLCTLRPAMSNICGSEDRKACLIANHGLIAWGSSLDEAYTIASEIESLCKQYLIARSTGAVRLLSDDEMQQVIEKFQDYRINKLQFESKGVLNG